MSEKADKRFRSWCIVELFGHRQLAGYVMEVELFGSGMLRLDVPDDEGEGEEPFATQFYSPGAVYCLTPVSEDTARRVAATARPAPVSLWQLPRPPEPDDLYDEPAAAEPDIEAPEVPH